MSKADIIADVRKYRKGWTGGLPQTPCGAGSTLENTVIQRKWIPQMVEKYGIKTIGDIGAGDLNWIEHVKWLSPVEYSAYDLVPRKKSVKPLDLIREAPPKHDLLMCLWVLNHLPPEQAKVAQENLLAAGSRYVMVTWWEAMEDFLDLAPIEEIKIKTRPAKDGTLMPFWLRLVKC